MASEGPMGSSTMNKVQRRLPWLAALLCLAAVAGFSSASPDYSQLGHPVALLGASGEPHALGFNLLGFVAPGLILAWCAFAWRSAAAADGWTLRIGLQLAMLSALAFAAQGLLPLVPYNLLAPASRLHAVAWTLWWVAFVPGALLLAAAVSRRRLAGLAFALLLPACALYGVTLVPAPLAERVAFVLWFGWWLLLPANRGAVSSRG